MSVFEIREDTIALPKMFFDEGGTVDIQRYDKVKYPIFKKLTDNAEANFWRPTEINLSQDKLDYAEFTVAEDHFFTSNLQRQIVLDSVQGRAPSLCYLPVVSDPWIESFINAWTFFEGIHSKSYTHIIENVYSDPSEVYNGMGKIREIVEVGNSVSKYYDELLRCQRELPYGHIDTKVAFYVSMMATNALEQIRFHISFAGTFSFGARDKMKGTCNIMTLIRQDESIHCGFTQNVLKLLPKDDPDFIEIEKRCRAIAQEIYDNVRREEQEWIKYLFSKGPILGITEQELSLYLDFLVAKSMLRMGLEVNFPYPKKEPINWMRKFLNEGGDEDQPPPQEEELTSYQQGNIDMDMSNLEIDF